MAEPGSRLPGRALFLKFQISDGPSIKPIRYNWLRRSKRLPGGEARLGNGPVDRFRAERAEPKGAARRSAGRDQGRKLDSKSGRQAILIPTAPRPVTSTRQ